MVIEEKRLLKNRSLFWRWREAFRTFYWEKFKISVTLRDSGGLA